MSIGGKALDSLVDFCKSSKMCAPRIKLAALSRPLQFFRLACVCVGGRLRYCQEQKYQPVQPPSYRPVKPLIHTASAPRCFSSDPETNTQHECWMLLKLYFFILCYFFFQNTYLNWLNLQVSWHCVHYIGCETNKPKPWLLLGVCRPGAIGTSWFGALFI